MNVDVRFIGLPIMLVPQFSAFKVFAHLISGYYSEIIKATDLAGRVAGAIRSFDRNLSYTGCRALHGRSMRLGQGNTGRD